MGKSFDAIFVENAETNKNKGRQTISPASERIEIYHNLWSPSDGPAGASIILGPVGYTHFHPVILSGSVGYVFFNFLGRPNNGASQYVDRF